MSVLGCHIVHTPGGLSVIIPVFNEVENVESLYWEIVSVLSKEPYCYEIIFVDDGSKDGTFQRLDALAATQGDLQVIRHITNYGQSAALTTGSRAAQYGLLVTMDGDSQNDPADIPRLLVHSLDAKTVVLGNRSTREDTIVRKFSSKIGNLIRRKLLDDDCFDTGCGLKIFPREAFLSLPHFNHFHRFLPALFKRAGFQLVNVPVTHRPRVYGVSKYGIMNRLFVGIYDLFGVYWLLKRPCAPEVCNHEL